MCDQPEWMVGSPAQEKSPEVSRKQVASFLVLSCVWLCRRDHFSLGDNAWVRLQPSSSERATFASPFCLKSDRTTKTHSNVNAKAFTLPPPRAWRKVETYCMKTLFSMMKSNWTEILKGVIGSYCASVQVRFLYQENNDKS